MPLYVFLCLKGHRFEYIRPIEQRDVTMPCPVMVETDRDFEPVRCNRTAKRIVVPSSPPHVIIH